MAELASGTDDGIAIKPLYTGADWPSATDPSGFPGLSPYTRGRRAAGLRATGWDVRQRHAHPDLRQCNVAIRQDIAGGVTSVLLAFDQAGRRGCDSDTADDAASVGADGAMISNIDDLMVALGDVDLAAVPVALDAGGAFLPASGFLKEAWRRHGVAAENARGAFNADPLGALAADGSLPGPAGSALRQMAHLARATSADFPNVRSIGIDATRYHEAGATEAQELACGLATGVAYLRALEDAGMGADAALPQMTLSHAADADLFMSIAKLRAARRLWARVAEACGAADAGGAILLHAQSSRRMMARRDPWVNMLRTTIASFAAVVGGADSVTTLPFDAALGVSDAFARRIARNTQLVLREESSLHRVLDPAGGAWALESIADSLAEKAWAAFQEIEAAGGMATVLEDGTLGARIRAKWCQRARRLAYRDEPVTGVSDFPDLLEQPVPTAPVDIGALRADAVARLARQRSEHDAVKAVGRVRRAAGSGDMALVRAVDAAAAEGATVAALSGALSAGEARAIRPLPRRRLAEAFEELRDRSDAMERRSGIRPTVFLAVIGELAQYGARATFARNAFAAAGIEAVYGPGGTDAEAMAAAFKASKSRVGVLCSNDTVYASHAAEWAAALRAAGAGTVLLAGTEAGSGAGASRAAAGVDMFMYHGCDMLGLLADILEQIGGLSE